MIRFKATVFFRDDSKKVYDCAEHPRQSGSYWEFATRLDEREFIPQEAIHSLKVKDYWKK